MRHLYVAVACIVASLSGCQNTRFKVVPVNGKVAFADGTALPTGTRLQFNPVEGNVGSGSASTSADGSFEVKHVNGSSGLEEGKYIVLLQPPEGDNGTFRQLVPKDYYDGGVLSVEAKDGMAPLAFAVRKLKKK
jgi:hypothetical protein